jgi:mono/diheme cytochrome c family protein
MLPSPAVRLALCLISAAALAGCSSQSDSTGPVTGKQLFQSNCGSCHELGDAGSGSFGPSLDGRNLTKEAVLAAIKSGPGDMPAEVVTGTDADKIAEFVASAD